MGAIYHPQDLVTIVRESSYFVILGCSAGRPRRPSVEIPRHNVAPKLRGRQAERAAEGSAARAVPSVALPHQLPCVAALRALRSRANTERRGQRPQA